MFRAWADCIVKAFVESTDEVLAFIQCTTSVMADVAIVVALMPFLLACGFLSMILSKTAATRP